MHWLDREGSENRKKVVKGVITGLGNRDNPTRYYCNILLEWGSKRETFFLKTIKVSVGNVTFWSTGNGSLMWMLHSFLITWQKHYSYIQYRLAKHNNQIVLNDRHPSSTYRTSKLQQRQPAAVECYPFTTGRFQFHFFSRQFKSKQLGSDNRFANISEVTE